MPFDGRAELRENGDVDLANPKGCIAAERAGLGAENGD
jgi:hypothetical protein